MARLGPMPNQCVDFNISIAAFASQTGEQLAATRGQLAARLACKANGLKHGSSRLLFLDLAHSAAHLHGPD